MPKVSLGTVYRNLDLLAERGIIQKLILGGREHGLNHLYAERFQ